MDDNPYQSPVPLPSDKPPSAARHTVRIIFKWCLLLVFCLVVATVVLRRWAATGAK
jgi:hypothetical protein